MAQVLWQHVVFLVAVQVLQHALVEVDGLAQVVWQHVVLQVAVQVQALQHMALLLQVAVVLLVPLLVLVEVVEVEVLAGRCGLCGGKEARREAGWLQEHVL